jgi:hypothetical protein
MIVTTNDFTGQWEIAKAFTGATKLSDRINDIEPKIMVELFGAEMYDEYTTAIGLAEPLEKWTKLRDAFHFDGYTKAYVSQGIKTMLKCFVYASYNEKGNSVPTTNGNINLKSEGGSKVVDNYETLYGVYNQGIKTFQAIQEYIKENSEDYPNYKGKNKQTSWFL